MFLGKISTTVTPSPTLRSSCGCCFLLLILWGTAAERCIFVVSLSSQFSQQRRSFHTVTAWSSAAIAVPSHKIGDTCITVPRRATLQTRYPSRLHRQIRDGFCCTHHHLQQDKISARSACVCMNTSKIIWEAKLQWSSRALLTGSWWTKLASWSKTAKLDV